jgi:predicted ester cyclase
MSDNTDLMQKAVRLYNAKDLDGFVNEYADGAILVTPDGRAEGREAIRNQWARELTTNPDRTLTIDVAVEQGDLIATEFTWVATNTGPWILPDGSQLAPTGKRIELTGMVLTKYRDGKMVVHHMYWDNMDAARQAELLPGS